VELLLAVCAMVASLGWLATLHRLDVWRRRHQVAARELLRWRYGVLDDAGDG
jgi:hypothetical protein